MEHPKLLGVVWHFVKAQSGYATTWSSISIPTRVVKNHDRTREGRFCRLRLVTTYASLEHVCIGIVHWDGTSVRSTSTDLGWLRWHACGLFQRHFWQAQRLIICPQQVSSFCWHTWSQCRDPWSFNMSFAVRMPKIKTHPTYISSPLAPCPSDTDTETRQMYRGTFCATSHSTLNDKQKGATALHDDNEQ